MSHVLLRPKYGRSMRGANDIHLRDIARGERPDLRAAERETAESKSRHWGRRGSSAGGRGDVVGAVAANR